MEVAKGWLEGGWGDLMGIEFEFGKMKVLEMEGGGECLGGRHPLHHECAAGVSHLLADFQHHGS